MPTSIVVLMAPFHKVHAARGARRLGAAGVLTKPFDMHALSGALLEAASG